MGWLVASPLSQRPGGQGSQTLSLEAADLEGLKTAAEEAMVAVSQTQADCFQLHFHAAGPPQPMSICTNEPLHVDSVFASKC